MNKISGVLLGIFLLALLIRFLFFPENIYFGFDQARDAYVVKDILRGDLKIVGPPTSFEGLHHGVLYYYILAPLYGLGNSSPEFVAAVLRVINALGVFLIFYLTKILFNKNVAVTSALLFATSFEATQFSIYMGNPSLAILSVMLIYLGLALVIFKKRWFGLPISLLGLGFSIQFQFALIYLIIPYLIILILFHKSFIKLPIKIWLVSGLVFIFSLITFILAELKYNFPTVHGLIALMNSPHSKNLINVINTYFYTTLKMITFNITGQIIIEKVVAVVLLIFFIYLLWKKIETRKLIFLGIWFFSLIITFIVNGGVNLQKEIPLYYPNIGVSISLLIFASFIIGKIWHKNMMWAVILIALILFGNFSLITKFNLHGTVSEIDVQQGMLLSDEKKVLDHIYQDAGGEPFAVKALTMPLYINTTWSYIFEWYGQGRYGYLPIWNGKNAEGFPGNLKVQEAQEGLPGKRYVIVEPTRGIPDYLINDFFKEEGYFTKVVEISEVGMFKIQKREKF